ncbi:MAG: MFS transporter [Chloroflexi bacterium]|nr:MFS transporter [Chloroflexota bacterium]
MRHIFREYPRQFWVLIGASFIDRVGGALLFPFFTLYITARFGVGMTTVGLIFGLFAISSMVGSTIGGGLTDRWGRKKMIIFGLVTSAAASVYLGLVDDIRIFALMAVLVGLLVDTAGPAQQAMVADLLPARQRADGYAIQRVMNNLAVVIGPAIGGFMAAYSYLLLFIGDAVTSALTAIIVYLKLDETKPKLEAGEKPESWLQTYRRYLQALRDRPFVVFLLASMLATLVYIQLDTTLAVYLRDVHGVPPQGYGWLLSLNALMVVLFQFAITRRLRPYPPMLMLAAAAGFLAVGFGLFGLVNTYVFFIAAVAILTIGEMIMVPVAQALVAKMAPEDMRGRYMAVYGFSWGLPFVIGPTAAGLVMDYLDPRWVWYAAFGLGCAAVVIFLGLYRAGVGTASMEVALRDETNSEDSNA